MWKKRTIRISGALILCAALVVGVSPRASAGGAGKDGTTPPKPAREKKVYTNDDIAAWHASAPQEPGLTTFSVPTQEISPALIRVSPAPYDAERDPLAYARQAVALENQAANLDAQIAQLRNFRATGSGVTTGLSIYAPCQGVGTDNLIAELVEQRNTISAQISDLEDTARRNDIPPGTFVNAPALVAEANSRVVLTPAGERARLTARFDRLTDDLAQVNGTVQGMEQDQAVRGMTLLKYNGDGGNMTTNLLQDLDGQAHDLRTQIASVADDASRAGVPASKLP
jgi:hypothetical protein